MKSRLYALAQLASIRLLGVGLQMFILLLIGRMAGPQGVGLLQVFTALTCSLGELSAVGLPTYAMRRLSSLSSKGDEQKFRTLMMAFLRKITCAWVMVVSGCLIYLALDQDLLKGIAIPNSSMHILYLSLSVLAFAITRLASESLKAISRAEVAILTENAGPPLIAALWLSASWWLNNVISGDLIIIAFTAGFSITAITLLALIIFSGQIGQPLQAASLSGVKIPFREHGSLWVTAMISILFLNYPFLVLPHFTSMAEMGVFALAFKLLNLVTTILIMLSAIYGPKFARADADGDFNLARGLLRQSQVSSLTLYLPILIPLLLGYDLIHPLFGSGFEAGYQYLIILAVGQLINAATGLPGALLNMMGQGKQEMYVLLGTVTALAIATPLVGLTFGTTGVAVLYATAIAAKSLGSYYLAITFIGRKTQPSLLNCRALTS